MAKYYRVNATLRSTGICFLIGVSFLSYVLHYTCRQILQHPEVCKPILSRKDCQNNMVLPHAAVFPNPQCSLTLNRNILSNTPDLFSVWPAASNCSCIFWGVLSSTIHIAVHQQDKDQSLCSLLLEKLLCSYITFHLCCLSLFHLPHQMHIKILRLSFHACCTGTVTNLHALNSGL